MHFRRIIAPHTDSNLGDCSFLDTCRHMKVRFLALLSPPSPTFLIAPFHLLLETDEVLIEVYVLFIQFSLDFAEFHTIIFLYASWP
jgi:hypothetical protein